METQRRFAVMGENLFKIANKIVNNQTICRLLKYQDTDPFSSEYEDVDGTELLHKQIVIVPKIPEEGYECSYIAVVFNDFIINQANPDFKITSIRFDILCPFSEWVINAANLRPYLIMQEIDTMFNQAKLSGLGKLQFKNTTPLVASPQLAGYSMIYTINEFN